MGLSCTGSKMAQLNSVNVNTVHIKICYKLRDCERFIYKGKWLRILQRIKRIRDKESK
jgi:hypothetical protein